MTFPFIHFSPILKLKMSLKERLYPMKGESNLQKIVPFYRTPELREQRRNTIRNGILATLGLDPLPQRTLLNAVIHSKRTYSDYSVENVFFESIPGFFVTGNLYRPYPLPSSKIPIMLLPHGHMELGRFNPDQQHLTITLARMGAVCFIYDMVGWEKFDNNQIEHHVPHACTFQLWNSIRALDFLTGLDHVDTTKIGVTGHSGGGTQTFLVTAVDSRITASAPVVMVSSRFYGGCVCESGLPIHRQPEYVTNNLEIASLAAPRPQLLVSIGTDWSRFSTIREYPFLQWIYRMYNAENFIEHVHIPKEKHDYGLTKRNAIYPFFAKHFQLNLDHVKGKNGQIDESQNHIESREVMRAFDLNHPRPPTTLFSDDAIFVELLNLEKK